LRIVQSFVNTLDVTSGRDTIEDPDQLAAWLADHGLATRDVATDNVSARQITEVREAIRELLLANNGLSPDPSAGAVIGRFWEQARPRIVMDQAGARLVPQAGGVTAAVGALLATVYEAIVKGTWTRLKACRDARCQRAFYASSKNHSGKWCAMARCGTRAKAGTRRRRRHAEGTV
jgi:predicted RNA-binding Zn ribbon-like protein